MYRHNDLEDDKYEKDVMKKDGESNIFNMQKHYF